MIQAQYKLLLVNLETGAQTDFAERLDSQAMQQPMPPTRAVYFAGWSPDMREAEVAFDGRCPPHHQQGGYLVTDMYIERENSPIAAASALTNTQKWTTAGSVVAMHTSSS